MSNRVLDELLTGLSNNKFADELRQNLQFHQAAYDELLLILQNIAIHIKDETKIDKRLSCYLYEIAKLIFVWKERLKNEQCSNAILIDKLEDAYVEIDALIAEQILCG